MMVFQHKETMFSVSYKTVSSRNNCSFYRAHTHEHVYKYPEVKSILFRNNISYHKGKKYVSLFTFDILHCWKHGIAAQLSAFLALET